MTLRDFTDHPDIDTLLGQDGLHIGARFGMNCEKQTAVRLRIAQQQAFMAFAQGFAGNDQAGIERMDER